MKTRSNDKSKKEINNNYYNNYMTQLTIIYDTNKLLFNTLSFYLGWICIHYVSSHLYSYYCTNYSLWGFLSSPIIATTPICRGLSWIIYTGCDKIFNMWNFTGVYLLNYLSSQ